MSEQDLPFGYMQFPGDMSEQDVKEIEVRLKELMERSRAHYVPLQRVTPTLATLDQIALEQIRAVVREELAALKNNLLTNILVGEPLQCESGILGVGVDFVHKGQRYKGIVYTAEDMEK